MPSQISMETLSIITFIMDVTFVFEVEREKNLLIEFSISLCPKPPDFNKKKSKNNNSCQPEPKVRKNQENLRICETQ